MTMTPERWERISRICEAALDRDAEGRDAFLTEACAGDEALRLEVDSLLRTEAAPALLDRSIWGVVASLLDGRRTQVHPVRSALCQGRPNRDPMLLNTPRVRPHVPR